METPFAVKYKLLEYKKNTHQYLHFITIAQHHLL